MPADDPRRSRFRLSVVVAVGVATMVGAAVWLSVGAHSKVSAASDACHRRVAADQRLPLDARFSDTEGRAIGDAIVIRGSVATRPVLTYTCVVRRGSGGTLDVRSTTARR